MDESPIEDELSGPTAAELRLPKDIVPIWLVFVTKALNLTVMIARTVFFLIPYCFDFLRELIYLSVL